MHRPPTPAFAQAVRQVLGIDDLIPRPGVVIPALRDPVTGPKIEAAHQAILASHACRIADAAAQRMREKLGSAQAGTSAEGAGGVGRQRMGVLVRGADNPPGVNEESSVVGNFRDQASPMEGWMTVTKQDIDAALARLAEAFPQTFVLEKHRPHRPLEGRNRRRHSGALPGR